MNKHLLVFFVLLSLLISCKPSALKQNKTENEGKVEETRAVVSKKAVVVFDQKYVGQIRGADLNDWRFSVRLYETPKTFWYRMDVVDRELEVSDTVVFPKLGMEMVPALKKGHEPNSCLVGFLDKQGNFLEYKKVVSGSKGLMIRQTKTYYVSSKKAAR
ncbi:hypothetical protein C3K47_17320 [Solitalea longa]|uniref:DUF192 domain-containing protein n=1 Tax=Solitalea longa TaxID=2079460 RepID=A0A2S4ZYE2_9SPHI|nr:hypothetical protein [Solitalea longa]POY35017.1 hypothetical protein C3K47_17320 [Solitalea longa]